MKRIKIVCFGDSLTVCGGTGGSYPDFLQQELPDCEVISRGIPGDTLNDGKKRFQADVLNLDPDLLIFQLGANDYWLRYRKLQSLRTDYEEMVAAARLSGIEVLIASCLGDRFRPEATPDWERLPLSLEECAEGIAAIEHDLAQRYRCFYLPDIQQDIRPDGRDPYWLDCCHPNAEGNRLVARRINTLAAKAIRKIRTAKITTRICTLGFRVTPPLPEHPRAGAFPTIAMTAAAQ